MDRLNSSGVEKNSFGNCRFAAVDVRLLCESSQHLFHCPVAPQFVVGPYSNTNVANSRQALLLLGCHIGRNEFRGQAGRIILSLFQAISHD